MTWELRRSARIHAQVINVNARPNLLQDLSRNSASPVSRRWDDLPGNYVQLVNDIGILLSPPVEIRIGPSLIEGAGLGLFIYSARLTLYTRTAVGKYWGNSTWNGGIPPEFAPRGARTPEGTRDNGAYLLRHMDYLVYADED